MNSILNTFAILNAVFIITFIITTKYIYKMYNKPQIMAGFGILMGGLFLIYFLLLILISIMAVFEHRYLFLIMGIFLVIPFIVGQKATYEKLDLYSNLQLLSLFASLSLSLIFIKCNY